MAGPRLALDLPGRYAPYKTKRFVIASGGSNPGPHLGRETKSCESGKHASAASGLLRSARNDDVKKGRESGPFSEASNEVYQAFFALMSLRFTIVSAI
jgi:hypothetical protein